MEFQKINKEQQNFNNISNIKVVKKSNSFSIVLYLILGIAVVGLIFFVVFNKTYTTTTNQSSNSSTQQQEVKTKEDIYLEKLIEATDFDNQTTRDFAVSLASKYQGEYNIDQVCNIFDYIYNNWKYVNDPRGSEFFSSASNSITTNLTGDCDDFAILMSSVIEAIGGKTRITLATNKKKGHAYCEVFFNEDPSNIRKAIDKHYKKFFDILFGTTKVNGIFYREDQNSGYWLNLDWSSKYPGGEYFKAENYTIYYPREKTYISINK